MNDTLASKNSQSTLTPSTRTIIANRTIIHQQRCRHRPLVIIAQNTVPSNLCLRKTHKPSSCKTAIIPNTRTIIAQNAHHTYHRTTPIAQNAHLTPSHQIDTHSFQSRKSLKINLNLGEILCVYFWKNLLLFVLVR